MLSLGSLRWAKPYPISQWTKDATWVVRSWFVTFSASQFQYLWDDVGPTARAYNGHPLAELNPTRRGALFQEWVRQMLQQKYPTSSITDADPGTCVNGNRRGRAQSEFDFKMDCKKVEVKSASLLLDESSKSWSFLFRNVKFPHLVLPKGGSFDVLYLVLFTPKWLHLVEHDMRTAISSNGLSTKVDGHQIHIKGARGATWQDSVDQILEKICKGGDCSLVATASISDSLISSLCEKHADYASKFFSGKPFSSMSPSLRGNRIEQLVLQIDQMLHPAGHFSVLCDELTRSGKKRGQNKASVDWIRDGKRIEVKHGKLSFCTSRQNWLCTFYRIKEDCFDELLLAVYSPKGLDVFKHDGAFGVTTNGRSTKIRGKRVTILAPCGELDPLIALQCIIGKLVANNCQHIASIVWDDGSLEQGKSAVASNKILAEHVCQKMLICDMLHELIGIVLASNNILVLLALHSTWEEAHKLGKGMVDGSVVWILCIFVGSVQQIRMQIASDTFNIDVLCICNISNAEDSVFALCVVLRHVFCWV